LNFIGHAYIARDFLELIPGNFAGDAYKGNLDKFDHLPKHILRGIRLHRYIDHFTDNAREIKEVGQIFKGQGISKVAFIASDILLDHFITKNWSKFSDQAYPEFIQTIYRVTDANLVHLEEEFCFLYDKLKTYKWLDQYPTEEGIDVILWQFSRRIGFDNDLNSCLGIYQNNRTEIDELFDAFMKEIVKNSALYIRDKLH